MCRCHCLAATMVSAASYNSGIQVRENNGQITYFSQPETSSNRDRDQACLQDLRITDPRDDKERIKATNGGLLKESYCWILDNELFKQWQENQNSPLLWIRGDPGKGKTMLLCGIIEELTQSIGDTANIAFFFCQATDPRINNATAVLRGLIYSLVLKHPSLLSHVRTRYDQAGKALFEDINAWNAVSKIFKDILKDAAIQDRDTYLMVDALDECTADLPFLLDLIVQESSIYTNVKWIVSSRNWPSIQETLDGASQKTSICLELNETAVAEAVSIFINKKVRELTTKKRYTAEIQNAVLDYLTANADGTFLWVALVCQYLGKVSRDHLAKLHKFPPGLGPLYKRMMDEMLHSEALEPEDVDFCKRILGFMAVAYRPITLMELTSFTESSQEISNTFDSLRLKLDIALCGSFLVVRDDIVYFVHQSAKEFLVENASNVIFPAGTEKIHRTMFSKSLDAMTNALRRNMYSLCALGMPISQIKQPKPDPLAFVKYSCVHWVDHLHDSHPNGTPVRLEDLQDSGVVDNFLRANYLHWLEALSLIGGISDGVLSMLKLESLVQESADGSQLVRLVHDARRFVLYHKRPIESTPLQVYSSALVFSPPNSMIRELFKWAEPGWVSTKPAIEDNWDACLQTLEGHTRPVTSIALSHDSRLLASVSTDRTIRVWDTNSGQCLNVLKGHSASVASVTFSHDSKVIASAPELDNTIKLWNIHNGQCLQTFRGHNYWVSAVKFSHDSKLLASASGDKTAKIWDVNDARCMRTLVGHSQPLTSVGFSHDSKLLASASFDDKIKLWDINNGQCIRTIVVHWWVNSVIFSPDSGLLASTSNDRHVKVWDTSSGNCMQTLKGHINSVTSANFSHDLKMLASASEDKTVRIWDVSNGQCLQTLRGHRLQVSQAVFSHDTKFLASASNDKTVKIWDVKDTAFPQPPDGHHGAVTSAIFSSDLKLVATGTTSINDTVKIWDMTNGQCQRLRTIRKILSSIYKRDNDPAMCIAFSHNFKILASAPFSHRRILNIWDTSNDQCLQTINCDLRAQIISIVFSHDVTLLALSSGCDIEVWDTVNWKRLKVIKSPELANSLIFSPDSRLLAYGSARDLMVHFWDGSKRHLTLRGHRNTVTSVIFSQDSKMLASASDDNTIRTWAITSEKCLQVLEGHSGSITSVIFSHNSKLIASASEDNTAKIWDASNAQCLQTIHFETVVSVKSLDANKLLLEINFGTIRVSLDSSQTDPQTPQFQGFGVSPDCTWITWNSQKLLWLPPVYRPSAVAVGPENIFIGCDSGRVLLFNFDTQRLLDSLSELGS